MSNLIVKDNALINASYNLDLVEQRLILLAIAEARESGKGINANDPLTIHSESYINQFEVHRTTAYQALKDACKSLFARQFSYQIILPSRKIHHKTTRWVSEIGYVEQDATVDLIFSPAVVPLITRLEKHFTNYEIQQVSKLSSAYAVRMYEILICWRSTGKTPIIELEDFRKRIGVLDTEYQRTDNLKMRVIEQSIKQINQHTDITASYEQHKKGRVITGFSFKFKQKKQNSDKMSQKNDSGFRTEKTVSIPTNFLKQPENANIGDLNKRASQIAGLIISNGLTARFKQGDESSMDMMKRIKQEIISNKIADQWQSKLEEFGVVF